MQVDLFRGVLVGTAALAAAVALALPVLAQHAHRDRTKKEPVCAEATLACAQTATPAFGPDGTLWLAYAAAGRIMVTSSRDGAKSFAPAVAVNRAEEQLDWGPDARPQIVVGPDKRITVAYTIFKDKHFNGQVRLSRSLDGGAAFGTPVAITEDPESQRFIALGLDTDGRVFAAWLDKRLRAEARARGQKYPGAALAYTWLDADAGPPKIGEIKLAKDQTCECCRLGIAFAGPGKPVVIFRNIFDGSIRDHAIVRFSGPQDASAPVRVSDDAWKTEACPHHGPAIAVSGAGTTHAAWFTSGSIRRGLFHARAGAGAAEFSTPMQLGTPERQSGRAHLAAVGVHVSLVWKEFDGDRTVVLLRTSDDDGTTWSADRAIAETGGDSDHPLLVTRGSDVYLSWLTRGEGYRLVPLGASQ